MTAINPPPQDAPEGLKKASRDGVNFWQRLLKSVYLIWFYVNPMARQKELTGTTAASASASVTVAHGLDSTKIKGFTGAVITSSGEGVGITTHCDVSFDATNITITNSGSAPSSVLSKTFYVYVHYK